MLTNKQFTYKEPGINAFGERIEFPRIAGWESSEAAYGYQAQNVLPVNLHPINISRTQKQLTEEVANLTKNDSNISPFDKVSLSLNK